MIVLLPLLAVSGVLAGLVLAAVARWPGSDPGVPQGAAPRRRDRLARVARRRIDPEARTGLALTGAAAGILALGAVAGMVDASIGLAHFDLGAAEWAAERSGTVGDLVLRGITALGSTIGVAVLAVVVLVASRHRLPVGRAAGLLAVVLGGQWLLVNGIKLAVDRARPDLAPYAESFGSSFPSGHAAAAAAGFAAMALLLGRGRSRRSRAALAALAAGLAGAVATSRVLLGVHWVTDVVAGLALGWGWFAFCSVAYGGRRLDFGAPLQ